MIEFKLSGDEVDLILKALLQLPAKESMRLILKLDSEADAQVNKVKPESSKKQ